MTLEHAKTEAKNKGRCQNCGWVWSLSGQPGRSETCPSCRADLRICLNCEFYDLRAAHQCRERRAEPVMTKDRSNFCEFFEISNRPGKTERTESDAKDRLKRVLGI